MRKILSGRRGSGRGSFRMRVNTAIADPYGFQTSSNTNQFYFPIFDGSDTLGYTISFTIDWGDGTSSIVNSLNYATACLHTYSVAGQYTISAEGNIAGFNFWNVAIPASGAGKSDGNKLIEILNWGDLKLTGGNSGSAGQTFRACTQLAAISAADTPWFPKNANFNSFNSLGARGLFSSCNSLVTINNIANWDVTALNAMQIMFSNCVKWQFGTNANGPIDLTNWDVRNISQFERTFNNCQSMNAKMFSNVGANVSSIPSMKSMFKDCFVFNNNNTGSMNSWDTSKVQIMEFMFEDCRGFNDNITSWDTTSVTRMRLMFQGATVFNQNISSWNTASVNDMRDMFTDATAFNQPIGNWDVNAWSQVGIGDTPLTGPATTFTLSTNNYNALLLAWDAYTFPSWPGGVVDFGNSQYSLGDPGVVAARTSLANKWGTLNDGGGI